MKTFEEMTMSNDLTLSELTEEPKKRSFRWRMIPATLLGIFAAFGFLMGIVPPLIAAYLNMKYGWIVATPDNPSSKHFAFNLTNVSLWQLSFWIGVVGTVSVVNWVRGRWYWAWGTTALAYILVVLAGVLQEMQMNFGK